MFREKFGERRDRWNVSRNHLPVFFNPRAEARDLAAPVSRHVALERRRGGTRHRRPRGFFHFHRSCAGRPSTTRFQPRLERPPTRCACPSFYFCNRVSLCFAPKPRSRTNPFSFSSLNRLPSVFPPWSIFSPRLFLDFVRSLYSFLSLSSFSFRPLPSLEDYMVEDGVKSEFKILGTLRGFWI